MSDPHREALAGRRGGVQPPVAQPLLAVLPLRRGGCGPARGR